MAGTTIFKTGGDFGSNLVETANYTGPESLQTAPSKPLETARSDAVLLGHDRSTERSEEGKGAFNLEDEFAKLPTVREQLTWRALFIGLCLGVLFSIITMKLNLQSGVIPGFGLASCMIGFVAIRGICSLTARFMNSTGHYYPQETTIMQTMATATSDLAFSGGFASFILSMSPNYYDTLKGTPGININDALTPSYLRIMAYQIFIAFIGLFLVLHIKHLMIIGFGLPYPSSRAAGVLIKTMHSKAGAAQVKSQMKVLFTTTAAAFFWDFFEYFFSGNPTTCTGGFANMPSLGPEGLSSSLYGWNWNWAVTYPGIGMLCPPLINWSMLLGALVVNGCVLPIVVHNEGNWYPAGLGTRNIQGQYAFAVFPTMAFFLAEGLYTIVKITATSAIDVSQRITSWRAGRPHVASGKFFGRIIQNSIVAETPEEKALSEYVFTNQNFPMWWSSVGYLFFLVLGTICIPQLYPAAKWYYCLVAYLLGPLFSLVNAYSAGLTDWNIAGPWAILGICIISAWAGQSEYAILGSLAVSGIFSGATNAAASITGDFKTARCFFSAGYYTLTNPKAMLIAQILGEIAGVFIAPATFYMYYKGNNIGLPGSTYQSPFSTIDLGAAAVIYEGIGHLPHNCLLISGIIFFGSLAICLFRDFGPEKIAVWMPSPLAMGIPGIVGAWVAVGMWLGSLIAQFWAWYNKKGSLVFIVPVAVGLLVGEGLWSVPQSILSFAGVIPPMCMGFFKSGDFAAAAAAAPSFG